MWFRFCKCVCQFYSSVVFIFVVVISFSLLVFTLFFLFILLFTYFVVLLVSDTRLLLVCFFSLLLAYFNSYLYALCSLRLMICNVLFLYFSLVFSRFLSISIVFSLFLYPKLGVYFTIFMRFFSLSPLCIRHINNHRTENTALNCVFFSGPVHCLSIANP